MRVERQMNIAVSFLNYWKTTGGKFKFMDIETKLKYFLAVRKIIRSTLTTN